MKFWMDFNIWAQFEINDCNQLVRIFDDVNSLSEQFWIRIR